MNPDESLIVFGWLFIGFMFLLILVPYVWGKSDLVTTWNLFLAGSAVFVGASSLDSANSKHYVTYTKEEYRLFMWGVVTFYLTLTLTYYRWKYPRRLAGRRLRKWPPVTVGALFLMSTVSFFLVALPILLPPIEFIRQLTGQVGNKAIAFSVVLSFVAWYRQKFNPTLLILFLATLLLGLVFAILWGGGRRTMVSVAFVIPLCIYWIDLRNRSVKLTLSMVGMFAVLCTVFMTAYNTLRHFDRGKYAQERTFATSFATLKELPSRIISVNAEYFERFGQNAAEASLLSIHMYTTDFKPEPFHAALYVLVNPIPRAFWPEKPLGLGKTLPIEFQKQFGAIGTHATWGPGIVGHGFHEGGLHMLVLYGVLAGAALRFFDELLMRQPGNPYLLGFFAAASGHILGWPRGDIGTFSLQIIASFLMLLAAMMIGRLLFGTGLEYPVTDRFDACRQGLVLRRKR